MLGCRAPCRRHGGHARGGSASSTRAGVRPGAGGEERSDATPALSRRAVPAATAARPTAAPTASPSDDEVSGSVTGNASASRRTYDPPSAVRRKSSSGVTNVPSTVLHEPMRRIRRCHSPVVPAKCANVSTATWSWSSASPSRDGSPVTETARRASSGGRATASIVPPAPSQRIRPACGSGSGVPSKSDQTIPVNPNPERTGGRSGVAPPLNRAKTAGVKPRASHAPRPAENEATTSSGVHRSSGFAFCRPPSSASVPSARRVRIRSTAAGAFATRGPRASASNTSPMGTGASTAASSAAGAEFLATSTRSTSHRSAG